VGFGSHLDARIALQRAYAEMNQMLCLARIGSQGELEDAETVRWLNTATLANQPYFVPDAARAPARFEEFARQHSGDLLTDIDHCRNIVEELGMEMFVLDQTRDHIGMPVAKVVVPGLRHFWARFAPGRLYDVPLKMGWLDTPFAEADLNPIPVFF
jgi:ribosomal protein S12 methylthiotransferase accessory factor